MRSSNALRCTARDVPTDRLPGTLYAPWLDAQRSDYDSAGRRSLETDSGALSTSPRCKGSDPIARIARRFRGDLQVAAVELRSGEQLMHRAEEVAATASTIKIPILVEVYRQARAGALSLDERLELSDEMQVGGSGVLKELAGGLKPTIADLATLMGVISDNTATNMLIDRVGGVDAINATMHGLGMETIVLRNRVDFEAIGGDIRLLGEASALDLARLVEFLLRGDVVDAASSAAMVAIMRRQQYLDQVPRYLDVNPYALELGIAPPLEVASKTGFYTGTRVDMGALFLARGVTVAYCVSSTGSGDSSFAPENEGSVVNGLVGRELVRHWWPQGAGQPPLLRTAYDL
jgi:beta-lactamase class A